MKRTTAYKYCEVIHNRLKGINGRLFTPGYNFEYVDFLKIYVVGSFAKGKEYPNDLDILIIHKKGGNRLTLEHGGILDHRYLRTYGIEIVKSSSDFAFKWLTKGMKKVHKLCAEDETTEFDVKIEIYPNFDIAALTRRSADRAHG